MVLPSLKLLSAKGNYISTIGESLPKSLEELVIDDNNLVDVPEWVYSQVGLKFSALPLCKRGEVLDGSHCRECEPGSYAITGGGDHKTCKKDGCGDDRWCLGRYIVLPKTGWWRGLPYFRTAIDYTDPVTSFTGNALWDENVHIYRCPNVESCLTSENTTYSYCADGYTGPACALCDASLMWLEGHRCIQCKDSAASFGWFVASSVLAPLVGCVLLYLTTARPLFRAIEKRIIGYVIAALSACPFPTRVAARARNAQNTHRSWLDHIEVIFGRLDVWKERLASYHEIYTEHKAAAGAMLRSMIGFLQVIGNIGKLIRWPAEFVAVTSWFTFLKLSFDVPSVGCIIHRAFEYTFYDRLLLYCLGPIAIIAVLNLPLACSRLWQFPRALRDEVHTRCIAWTLRVLFMVYPIVSQLVISALVCKQLGPDLWLLSYDYRVNCLEARYEVFKNFALAMLVLWTIGYPLSMLIVMKMYGVPDMAGRKQRKAELHALCWLTLKLAPRGPPRQPNHQRVEAATSDPLATTADVPELRAAEPSSPVETDVPLPADSEEAGATDWLAGEAGTLRELSVDTLSWLCDTHKLEVDTVEVPRADAMAAALERRIAELIDSEELAVPRVKWDSESADEGERLACAHIGSMFESYEPDYWWYASVARPVAYHHSGSQRRDSRGA